ncbi:MAG: hypothetical protein GX894_03760 [Clostridia bacterium]|nr:hypothetical protein [Clostridia bacterium]
MFTKIRVILGLPVTGDRIKKPFLTVASITLPLVMAILFSSCQKPRTPSEELIMAMKKTYDYKTLEVNSSLNLEIQIEAPEAEKIQQILNNITLQAFQKSDEKNLRYQMDLKLLYKGQNCGSLTLYADLEKLVLQSPFLSPRPFFLSWKDFPALTSQYLDGVQVCIADYFPLLFDEKLSTIKKLEEAIYPAYADFLAGKVRKNPKKTSVTLVEKKGKTTYSCREYIVTLKNDETLQEDYKKFFIAILENTTIRNLLREKITAIIEIAKNNGDLATWPWTEEEIQEFAANLDTNLDQLVEFITGEYPQLTAPAPGSQMEVKYRINVDESGIIRAMVMDQTMGIPEAPVAGSEPVVKVFVETQMLNFGEEPEFMEFNPAGAFDAGRAPEEDWEAMIEEIKINFFVQLYLNPLFQELSDLLDI